MRRSRFNFGLDTYSSFSSSLRQWGSKVFQHFSVLYMDLSFHKCSCSIGTDDAPSLTKLKEGIKPILEMAFPSKLGPSWKSLWLSNSCEFIRIWYDSIQSSKLVNREEETACGKSPKSSSILGWYTAFCRLQADGIWSEYMMNFCVMIKRTEWGLMWSGLKDIC